VALGVGERHSGGCHDGVYSGRNRSSIQSRSNLSRSGHRPSTRELSTSALVLRHFSFHRAHSVGGRVEPFIARTLFREGEDLTRYPR
jgi:hypothetical protein